MIILGYSGLNGSDKFRNQNLTGATEQELAFIQGMDAAAALIEDGNIIAAAEEERFTNKKHTCDFPINAINYCLEKIGIEISKCDAICHGFDFNLYAKLYQVSSYGSDYYNSILSPSTQIQMFNYFWPEIDVKKKFFPINHHLAHAGSCFYPSQFENALVVIADGIGEIHSTSVYHGTGNQLEQLSSDGIYSSIGLFYAIVTSFLGFYPNSDEYKVMGLAPYGDPNRYQSFFDNAIHLLPNGKIHIPSFSYNRTTFDKQTYRMSTQFLMQHLGEPRRTEMPIQQYHKDIAASLQKRVNEAMLHLVLYWQQQTKASHLCMAGGVALNCVANGVIHKSDSFEDIYIQPAAGDAGTALGAALTFYHQKEGKNRLHVSNKWELPFYGPSFNRDEICQAISQYTDKIIYVELTNEELLNSAAEMISENNVIAWMQGQMEYGPRALGNRSILANPLDPNARDIVNRLVKKRESFRPFAPAVKYEKAHYYFDINENEAFPFMLFTVPVRDEYRKRLSSITHVDGSARLQTVDKTAHSLFWHLLDAIEIKTDFPMVLNTSFNLKGQAIVCNPTVAIDTFLNTELNALYIGNFKIIKKTIN